MDGLQFGIILRTYNKQEEVFQVFEIQPLAIFDCASHWDIGQSFKVLWIEGIATFPFYIFPEIYFPSVLDLDE